MPSEVEEVSSEVSETGGNISSEGVETPPAADPYDDPETDKFDRAYVEKLRKENAERRTAVRTYEEIFDGYDPTSKQFLLDLARDLKSDDPDQRAAAAQRMKAVGEKLTPAQQEVVDETNKQLEQEGEKPMTRAEIKAMLQEEEQRKAEENEIESVYKEAEELGYARGSRQMADLLFVAAHETGGDVKKAHELTLKGVQDIVDTFVRQQQEAAGEVPVTSTSGGAPPPPKDEQPKTLKEAAERTARRLDQAFGPR